MQWLGKQSFLDDLASLDPDLYQGLIFLKHYIGNPEDLALNFTVAEEGTFITISSILFIVTRINDSTFVTEFGVTNTIDLIPDGSNVAVTRENRLHYIYLVSHYRLTKQSEAFFEGLSDIIDPKWLRFVDS
jgi:ubiquitin-protein ligase E3 C